MSRMVLLDRYSIFKRSYCEVYTYRYESEAHIKGRIFEFWPVKKCSGMSLQPYTNVKMIRKRSEDGPNRYAKLVKGLFQTFVLWYKNRVNCCLYSYCAIQQGRCCYFKSHRCSRDKNWAAM